MNSARIFLIAGALLAALGVAMGAFGAHGLKSVLAADRLAIYHTAVQYQLWHALGLLLVGTLAGQVKRTTLIHASGWFMLVGLVVFSGSLYVLTLSDVRWLGPVTPLGGTALIVSWLLLALALLRR